MAERACDILLIGGGIASASAAAELRDGGFEGTIVLATREADAPYHRPPLTKGYLRGDEDRAGGLIHPHGWWEQNGVELALRTPVADLDVERRSARLGRERIGFGRALIATGSGVRRLQVPGGGRDGVHYLRAYGNADRLRAELDGAERVAVVGGSFIATEIAASLTVLGRRVTMVMQERLPLERAFGPLAGRFVHDLLTARGVELIGGTDVAELAGPGEDGRVEELVCVDGRRVACDLVVAGVGAFPDVMVARRAGLELGESGGVACDARLRTSADAILAAGDVCEYDSVVHGRRLRVEHEEVAAAQGRHAARAMLGSDEPYAEVPYFWTDIADWATLEYVGPAERWEEEIVRGEPAEGSFSILYVAGGRVVAGLAAGRRDELEQARALVASGARADELR